MATGCIPIVHKSGGPWIDILDKKQGLYGYAYRKIDEASVLISEILNNEDLKTKLSTNAKKRANDFNSSIFEKKILKIVDVLLEKKSKLI